jgi:hypothetical protein
VEAQPSESSTEDGVEEDQAGQDVIVDSSDWRVRSERPDDNGGEVIAERAVKGLEVAERHFAVQDAKGADDLDGVIERAVGWAAKEPAECPERALERGKGGNPPERSPREKTAALGEKSP